MKKIFKTIGNIFFGKKALQKPFELLYRISLKGMNFGSSEVEDSGEAYVLEQTKKMSGSPIIFDVGANKGQYANLINKVFDGSAKIYSFEPGKFTYSELLKNIKNIKNVKTYNFGLGSEERDMYLNYDDQGSGLASVYERKLEHANIDFKKKEKIDIRTLDGFCKANKIERIDLLKIDVEGHEMEVLKGAKTILDGRKISAIQFEFGGCNIDSRTYFQDFFYLLKKDYAIYRILQDGLREIRRYSELQEIFTTVNYYAKLKS
jgi:FkbM family methyltransferase